MMKLPFHVDSPLAAGVFSLAVSLAFAFLYWAYDRNVFRIGDGLGWFFERQFGMVAPDKARRAGRGFLLAMAILFGCMALFGISVGTGVIENGDPPKPIAMEEFLEEHRN
ncbi:MAG TPA: hypothetical protein ENH62_13835 [Marinobacter sp.]|uniref:Uncharacterized protein n=1 Tax=marine sediment metagenome TaxID=412755 RepID=A0A0F9H8W6_9ZZZZ|nr:hypothetical protein [Marinobacter sp.]